MTANHEARTDWLAERPTRRQDAEERGYDPEGLGWQAGDPAPPIDPDSPLGRAITNVERMRCGYEVGQAARVRRWFEAAMAERWAAA